LSLFYTVAKQRDRKLISLTVKAGHVERLPLDEAVTLVQFSDEQLATAEEMNHMVLVQRNAGGDIAAREMKRQQSINQSYQKKQHKYTVEKQATTQKKEIFIYIHTTQLQQLLPLVPGWRNIPRINPPPPKKKNISLLHWL
jgi:hypothetical protein